MRAARHHKRQLHLAFELLEPRSMLAAGSLAIAPLVVHAGLSDLAAAVSTAKLAPSTPTPAVKIAKPAVVKPAVVAAPLVGDLNHNNRLDLGDFLIMETILVNLSAYESANSLTYQQLVTMADVSGDGKFNNADLQALLTKIIETPPPPPPTQVPLIVPTGLGSSAVIVATTSTAQGPPAVSHVVVSGSAGAFAPLQSSEALLAGGGGGNAQPNPPTANNNGPPMPTRATTSDVALIAFASNAGGGGDEVVQGMLMNLADVEEPQMLAIEYGDEVVKHEVTVNKTVVPSLADQPVGDQPVAVKASKIVAEAITPPVDHAAAFPWHSYWWLLAIPAGAMAATGVWWIYRQRLLGNVGTLLRRLGL